MAFVSVTNPPSTAPLAGIYNIDQMPALQYQQGVISASSNIDGLTATGTTQITALQVSSSLNRFTTVTTSNYGAILPVPATGGIAVRIINNGASPLSVYPQSGAQIDLGGANNPFIIQPNSAVEFYAGNTTNWQANYYTASNAVGSTQYVPLAGNTPLTLVGANMAGSADCTIFLSATLAGAGTLNSATAAQIVAAIPNAAVGFSYNLRIINASSGAFAWTLTTATGITLNGTQTIAQNTFRDYYVTITSLTAVSIQSVGTGTNS